MAKRAKTAKRKTAAKSNNTHEWIDAFHASVSAQIEQIHPSARCICGEYFNEMRRAAEAADMDELARLIGTGEPFVLLPAERVPRTRIRAQQGPSPASAALACGTRLVPPPTRAFVSALKAGTMCTTRPNPVLIRASARLAFDHSKWRGQASNIDSAL
jgi:hypothetical protein